MNTPYISTAELAEQLRIKARSIHHALCLTGSYCGIKPRKLPNNRLLWPADAAQSLISSLS